MGWSMDRQEWTRDRESRRLKQVELSGSRRERVSLATYPDDLSAREAEVCQDAKYGRWCEPTAAPAAGRPLTSRNSTPETAEQRPSGGVLKHFDLESACNV